jgi:prepilin-type N-terminal cleavage/methylation domain-containing protein
VRGRVGRQIGGGGFTLVELVIAVTIIAIVLAIAIPNLVVSRMRSNEAAVAGRLRSISSAQFQFRECAKADEDFDGEGEFGTFGEMGGRVGVRGLSTKVPTDLTASMSLVDVAGEVQRAGFVYRIYLPRADGSGEREQPYGGMRPGVVDADQAERHWVCYAWPVNSGISGSHTFVVNQDYAILKTEESRRSGQNSAYVRAGDAFVAANPDSLVGPLATGSTGSDGNVWVAVD